MTRNYTSMRTTAFLLMTLVATDASAQQEPVTGYAPINGINMYYEIHGGGEPGRSREPCLLPFERSEDDFSRKPA